MTKFQVNMPTWCWRKHFLCHVVDAKIGFFRHCKIFNNFLVFHGITLKLYILVHKKSKYLQNKFDDVTVKTVYFTDQNIKIFDFRGFWAITFSLIDIFLKPEVILQPLILWTYPENFRSIQLFVLPQSSIERSKIHHFLILPDEREKITKVDNF